MRHKLTQTHRLQQRMALTPQMRQSIELLAMPAAELSEYVDSILEKNPFLKKMVDERRRPNAAESNIEPQVRAGADPRQSLMSQLIVLKLSEEEARIAEYLIYEIDDNGYVSGACLEEAAADLAIDIEKAEEVLEAIQKLEPAGIGARDAKECLKLQLERMGRRDSLEYKIVKDYIDELAAHDVKRIALRLKTSEGEVLEAFEAVRKLNPKPASTLLGKEAAPVIPDLVARVRRGRVSIGINRDFVPMLTFYNPYAHKPDLINDPDVRKFVKANESAARDLLDSLKRREETMCRVASYILNFQTASLKTGGRDHIKTITIKDVAKALGFHPSTISRTISNKYVQVDERTLPLNGLLSNGMKKTDGEIISKSSVLGKIASIIKGEESSRPLSDDAIKGILAKEGIVMGRRTVAKYRNALNLLPRHFRKKSERPDDPSPIQQNERRPIRIAGQ